MSTLKVNNIQDTGGSNGVTPSQLSNGICKAWCNVAAQDQTPSIRDDYNVDTIGDNGNGDYTVNFTSNFSNANYAVMGNCWQPNSDGNSDHFLVLARQSSDSDILSTSMCRMDVGPSHEDMDFAVVCFGDT